MRDIRKALSWIFAATTLLHLLVSLRRILYLIHQSHASPSVASLFFATWFSVIVAAICGVAWWTVWKGKRLARAWAIAASVMNLLILFRSVILSPGQPAWDFHFGALIIGIIGLVAFSWRKGSSGDPAGQT